MLTAPTSGAAPEMAAPEQEAAAPGGDFEICIRSIGGQLSVGVEPLAEESKEESAAGEGGEEGDYQSVASVGEVCKLVREIVAHAGQMADTDASVQEMGTGYGEQG
jgi:hypothetical protein